MNRLSPRFTGLALAAILAAVLSACGGGGGGGSAIGGGNGGAIGGGDGGGIGGGGGAGGGVSDVTPPTATLSVPGGELGKNQSIVLSFSESMDVGSLKLGGEIGAKAVVTWSSSGSSPNDTLTLTPPSGGWESGPSQLSVDAADTAANALATVSASYVARLVFGAFPDAATVVGHVDFTRSAPSDGRTPIGADVLSFPYGSAVADDGTFFVADTANNRVLAYAGVPSSNGAAANFVLGQSDFTGYGAGTGQSQLASPFGVFASNGRLLVTDYSNNRVLIYKTVPADGKALPDLVLGQKDFLSSGRSCAGDGFFSPSAAVITPDGKIVVADARNNRVLIWNAMPIVSGQPADIVLGQDDFVHCTANDLNQDKVVDANPSAKTLADPVGLWSDGQRLVVADSENNRVLVWNSFPQVKFQPADVVLGQGSFTNGAYNDDDQDGNHDDQASAKTLNAPFGVVSDGQQLAISDGGNNRILVWNSLPTKSFEPADAIVGHSIDAAWTANDSNEDGMEDTMPSAKVFSAPRGVLFHRDSLIVNDFANSRVLVFRSR